MRSRNANVVGAEWQIHRIFTSLKTNIFLGKNALLSSRFVCEILTHQEMALSWVSTHRNIHAKDKPAQPICRPPAQPAAFPTRRTRRLPNSFLSIPEGECQPLAWTVMFPLWLPAWWMWRSLPTRRLRYAPAIFCFIVAVCRSCQQPC